MQLIDRLANPSGEYTPVPFWFLNGDLRHDEIRRQMKDFAEHHVYGVVLHPRMGMSRRIGYLSPVFFRYIRTAVETARELRMRVVFYDEGMYPSGSACGQVVAEHPELASRGIALTEAPKGEDRILCRAERGFLVERFSGGTIRGVHYGEDDGEPGAPLSADLLNPDAVDRFIELTHEAYFREFAPYFGSTVIAFFTDEPSILGRNVQDMFPWTAGFEALFTYRGGRLQGLEGLFTGEENADTSLYHSMILQRESEVYYGRLSRWCESHGIALMGHPHQSDDIEVEKYFQIPGQDLVYRWVSPEKGDTVGMDSVMGKCGADMAWWMGRKRNANECFGACCRNNVPWYFTGSDMKWYLDYLAVRGVNMFVPHAFYYSLAGKRSGERPPDVGPGSIWWPHYRRWADYIARLSCLMAECEVQADTAVVCRNRDLRPEAAAPLYVSQRGFRYLPESLFGECEERDGALICRGRRFRSVIGPEDMWPSVSHRADTAPDLLCCPEVPELRTARLKTDDGEAWLCVNAGETALRTEVLLPTSLCTGVYDLWRGEARKCAFQKTESGTRATLFLEKRQSLLFFTCADERTWEALPDPLPKTWEIDDRDFSFDGEDAAHFRKFYSAEVRGDGEDLTVRLNAEEMAELYVNGTFFEAAFWQPQVFRIPSTLLPAGKKARLRLTVTGNRANRYGHAVPYGLMPCGEGAEAR